jgi:quinol monooxygenase YgiN
MEFKPEHVQDFLRQFERVRPRIRAYTGVRSLELYRDTRFPNVFCTSSEWDSEEALETYRQSELFKGAWGEVKPWFGGKPQAFSLQQVTT